MPGRPGGQREYSDVAIETALTLRSLFHLGLRQTEGFVSSLVRLMGLELRVPDHTTLSRRGRTADVRSLRTRPSLTALRAPQPGARDRVEGAPGCITLPSTMTSGSRERSFSRSMAG